MDTAGQKDAFANIRMVIEDIEARPLRTPTSRDLRDLHARLGPHEDRQFELSRGAHPSLIAEEMELLQTQMHEADAANLEPVEKAGFFLARFVAISPFSSGNLRTGWLMAGSMLVAERAVDRIPAAPARSKILDAVSMARIKEDLAPVMNLLNLALGRPTSKTVPGEIPIQVPSRWALSPRRISEVGIPLGLAGEPERQVGGDGGRVL